MARPELPPEVARAFVRDMQAYFAEPDPILRDQIAVLQLRALESHWKGRKLRLSDIQQLFALMREQETKKPAARAPGRRGRRA